MRWWAVLGLVWLCAAPVVAVLVGSWFARRRRRDSVAVEDAMRLPEDWPPDAPTEPGAREDGPAAPRPGTSSGRDVLPML